jgi:hypothetical protein
MFRCEINKLTSEVFVMIHPAELLEYMQNQVPEDKRDDEIVQLLLPLSCESACVTRNDTFNLIL